jgi:hypothetical protein
MKFEANQSSSRPRSSTISSAPRKVADQEESDEIEPGFLRLIRFIRRQEHGDQPDRCETDRTIDQEAPSPSEIISEPATQRRADHRRDNHRNAEEREGLAALLRRESVRQDRLRHGHHAASREALQDPEQKERIKIPSLGTQDRAYAEKPETDQEEGLAAEPSGEEGARGQADGVGDQIGRDHPRRFVVADPHPARDIGQDDIGDRGVEHLHEGRKRDQDGDQPSTLFHGAARRRRAGPDRRVGHSGPRHWSTRAFSRS